MANVYVRSGATGAADGSSWADAYTTLAAAFTAKAAGDIFFVSEDHAETQASSMTMTSPGTAASPCFVYCVDHTGSVPPVSADLRTTATITTTGTFALSFVGYVYCYGVKFTAGNSGSTALNIGSASATQCDTYLKSCALAAAGSNNTLISMGSSNSGIPMRVTLDNTTVSFSATTQGIAVRAGSFTWKDTPSALLGAAVPTTLFANGNGQGINKWLLEGVDLSAAGSGKTLFADQAGSSRPTVKDCKLNASVAITATPTGPNRAEIHVLRTDSAGTNYRDEKYAYHGTQTVETTLVRTGGASNGTTSVSWKVVTTANAKWAFPFELLPISINNTATAADVVVTMEGIWDAAALPNNDEFWFDVEYLGSSSTPMGSFKTATKADGLASGTALTASTQAWDSGVTARANSTAYSVGDKQKVASNSGRVFFCTTAGTTAGSEPGGYATAVDGDSITDNTAVFRAGVRFKKAVTLTSPQPAMAGNIYVSPKAGKASATFYICPKLVLS